MKKTKRLETRVTEEELDMVDSYCKAVDRDRASLVRHAVWAMMRQDKRRVDEKFHKLLFHS